MAQTVKYSSFICCAVPVSFIDFQFCFVFLHSVCPFRKYYFTQAILQVSPIPAPAQILLLVNRKRSLEFSVDFSILTLHFGRYLQPVNYDIPVSMTDGSRSAVTMAGERPVLGVKLVCSGVTEGRRLRSDRVGCLEIGSVTLRGVAGSHCHGAGHTV